MPAYVVRRADLVRDRDEIIDLWQRNDVNGPDQRAHLAWAYEHNPAGTGGIWLLRDAGSDALIGACGAIMRTMRVHGEEVRAGRTGGLAVDARHRTLGPILMVIKALLEDCRDLGVEYVYTVAPPGARPVFDRLRFSNLGSRVAPRMLVSCRGSISARLPWLPDRVAMAAARVIDPVVLGSARWPRGAGHAGEFVDVEEFDARFDDLWRRGADRAALASNRSGSFLRWRFTDNPNGKDCRCWALVDDEGRIDAYVVYRRVQRTAIVLDAFASSPEAVLPRVFVGLAENLRRRGVDQLSWPTFGSGPALEAICRQGSWRTAEHPDPYSLHVVRTDLAGAAAFDPGAPWSFTMADDFLNQ